MGLILDLIVIAIIFVFALLSAKRGFVRTIIEIVGFVLVILFANSVSPVISDFTYDKLVEPSIVNSVEKMQENGTDLDISLDTMPKFVSNILGEGFDLSGFQNKINENISEGINSAITSASQTVVKPVVTGVLDVIFTIILTMVLSILVNLLAKFINKLFSFSLVGKANKILGAVLGIIKGVVICAIICTVISLIVSLTTNGILIFTQANIDSTNIFKLLNFSNYI